MTFTRLSPQNLADLLELLRVIVTMFLGFGFLLGDALGGDILYDLFAFQKDKDRGQG